MRNECQADIVIWSDDLNELLKIYFVPSTFDRIVVAVKSQITLSCSLKEIYLQEDQNSFAVGGKSGICILRHCANFSQTRRVNEQLRNRWSMDSPSSAYITHTLGPCQFRFIRLFNVRIVSLMTNQKNALILGGTLTFHMTFANEHHRPSSFSLNR